MADYWYQDSRRWLAKAHQKVSNWADEASIPEEWFKRWQSRSEDFLDWMQKDAPETLRQFINQSDNLNQWYSHGSRYFDAGQTLLGIAVRTYAFQKIRLPVLEPHEVSEETESLHQKNATELAQLCRRQGGAWVKAAQFLSCQGDWLPHTYVEQLSELQDQAQSIAWGEIEKQLVKCYGTEWQLRFDDVETVPIATASIAQVHRAKTRGGSLVALKIQLPDAPEKIEADLLFFKRIAPLLQRWTEGWDVEQTVEELSKSIRRELDYYHEAANLTKFLALYEAEEWISPVLIPDLLNKETLAMSFVEGQPLRQFLTEVPSAAEPVLQTLVRSFTKQIFVTGLFHADPHPGNFFVTPQGKLALLDFGAVAQIGDPECEAYRNVLVALFNRQKSDFDTLLRKAGFEVPNGPLLLKSLFERDPSEFAGLSQMETHMRIMRRAEVKIPDNFVLMGRVLISIGGLLQQFSVKVNLQELALYLMMEVSRKKS
jgi:ubiquinone biosynthesis protein